MGQKANTTGHTKARSGKTGSRAKSKSEVRAPKVADSGPEEKQFVNGLLVRGEAAKLDSKGKLPLQATHVIEKENKDGSTVVRRARFKLF